MPIASHSRVPGIAVWVFTTLACTCGPSGFGSCSDEKECVDLDEDGFFDCGGWDSGEGGDCNDRDPTVHPGADEYCDGEDDDCNGLVDDDARDEQAVYPDDDGDGYGSGRAHYSCDVPPGYAQNQDDCDDRDATAYPGHAELCDGVDNDCDGQIDEDVAGMATWYADADGDGHGDASSTVESCDAPSGYVQSSDDCDDSNAAVAPGNVEICGDGVNEDCADATPDDCSYATATLLDDLLGGAYGRRADEGAGGAIAAAGDLDDDGYDDLLVGAAGSGATPPGVYLVMGPLNGMGSLQDAASHLETGTSADLAGTAVAGPGDVDGDGHPDVVFGAPGAVDDTGTTVGAVWLLYGPELEACSPFCDGAVVYGTEGSNVGYVVAAAGDTDGDGLDDFAIGAPGLDPGGGAALFVDAPTGTLQYADAHAYWASEEPGNAGRMVLPAGDIDDDGLDDLAIVDVAGARVWIATGAPTGGLLLSNSAARIDVPLEDGQLASVVLDDLDGDGVVDVLASAIRDEPTAGDAVAWGSIGPLSGTRTAGDDITLTTEYAYANAGVRAASLGDVDHDGSADLVFSAPAADALLPPDYSVTLSHGAALWVRPGPLRTSSSIAAGTTRVAMEGDLVPYAAGDTDRDLRGDLVLANPSDDTAATDAGAFYVLSGDLLF